MTIETAFRPLLESNDALGDASELKRRMDADGYVFLRRLQDRDALTELRRDMLGAIGRGGWLRAGTDPIDGIAEVDARCTEGDLRYTDVYHQVYRLESFHRAGHWPEVLEVMQVFTGAPVFPHPHKIARLWFPQYTDHTTPVHQDFVHFQSSFDVYTCWTPVGDCPIELGPLAVLPGSHRRGRVLDHHFSLGAGSLTVDEDAAAGAWRCSDFEAGDTLMFHCLTLHKALPNLTKDRLRISLDNRYHRQGSTISHHMLEPHLANHSPLEWDEVYGSWQTDDLKYYWRRLEMEVVPKDESFSETAFDEALALVAQGDERARLFLSRIVARDPGSEAGQRAAGALAAPDRRG